MTDELKHKKDDYQTIGCCGKKRKKPLLPLMKAENSLCKLKIFFEWVIPTFIEGRGFFNANYNQTNPPEMRTSIFIALLSDH